MTNDALAERMQAHWQRCIEHAEPILREMDPGADPLFWAASQRDLGCCYSKLLRGSVPENLRQAITCFHAALRIYTELEHPPFWAATQNNLGDVYARLPGTTAERLGYLRSAIESYEAVLRVYTEIGYPKQWAVTQNRLHEVRTELERLQST